MTMRRVVATTLAMAIMAPGLAGCGDGGAAKAPAARSKGTSSIEVPVPDATPHARTASGATTLRDAPRVTVGFPQGGAALDWDARRALDTLAADPAARRGKLILRGHSDSEGDDDANRRMSRKRAEAVRAYLADRGLARDRMQVIALGETRPIAPNARPDGSDDSAGRARNRRVEITLLPSA
ncbi:OmpA family protein [Sphingomonadaceae bacterium jetA1]|jgi:OOP family OmpA-OmpF porin|uniref:OmpA family protein n=1 Tax=Facivitalis istanbulensis TaxID=3075838 RepID=UPI0034952C7A